MQPPNKSAALHQKLAGIGACLRTACYEALAARAVVCYGAHGEETASAQTTDAGKAERSGTRTD